MDFRSQLSAFQSGGGSNGSSNNRGNNNNTDNNTNNSHNSSRGRSDRPRSRSPRPPPPRDHRHYDRDRDRDTRDRDRDRDHRGYYHRESNDRRDRNGRGGGGSGYEHRSSTSENRRRPRSSSPSSSLFGAHGPPSSSRRRYHSPDHHHAHRSAIPFTFTPPPPPRDVDGLGDLRGYGYPIPRGLPPPPTSTEARRRTKHICLLALIIQDLPYEHIWRHWADGIKDREKNGDGDDKDACFISLVCHAKFPQQVQSTWLKQRLLTHPPQKGRGNSFMSPEYLTRQPNWGSVDITRAMVDLLEEGLKIGQCTQTDPRFAAKRFVVYHPNNNFGDNSSSNKTIPPVDHFLYISESCLPVATASEFVAKIPNAVTSWVNGRHRQQEGTPQNKYEDDQFAGIHRKIPGQCRWKADQWVLLSRRHAVAMVDLDRPPRMAVRHQLWQSFANINASDELYVPTSLALLGYLRITKDGHDTQRARGLAAAAAAAAAVSEKKNPAEDANAEKKQRGTTARSTPSKDKDATTDDTTTTTPTARITTNDPPTNDCLELRPVTYTDWSEGMRNPQTFVNGFPDLKRVGKQARDQGCLVARKFAPFVKLPGVRQSDLKVTGEISVDDWEKAMRELQESEKEQKKTEAEKVATVAAAVPAATEQDAGGSDGKDGDSRKQKATDDANNDIEDDEGDESFLNGPSTAATATTATVDKTNIDVALPEQQGKKPTDTDDDEEENELE